MADILDEKHGTSEEYVDPYCDTCFEAKGLNVKVFGYCKDCYQFLCSDCHILHGKFRVAKDHIILQGSSMPQSQADKPPKFHDCKVHPALLKDMVCCGHKNMICSSCSSGHSNCIVQSIEDVCKNTSPSETDSLYDKVKDLQDQARSVTLSIETYIKEVKEQRKFMLKEAQIIYDEIISEVDKLYDDIQSDIEADCQAQILLISEHQDKINDVIAKLDLSINDIENIQGRPVDTNLFLKIQEIVNNTNRITDELRNLNNSSPFTDLSFVPNKQIHEFLSESFTLGSVKTSAAKRDTNIVLSDVVFPAALKPAEVTFAAAPQQTSQNAEDATGFQARPVSQINATKQGYYRTKLNDDKSICYTNGMAIAEDGRIIIVDFKNYKVKLFSHDMKFLSSTSLPKRPWDIALVSEEEAVVTTDNNSLVLLDISGTQLHIKSTINVSYDLSGISKYDNRLVISSVSDPPSVKMIDLSGKVYWSVSSDQQGQPLFNLPHHLTTQDEGRASRVVVSDSGNSTLTLLNGETGEIITRRQLQESDLRGVTTDTAGNVYVCNWEAHEVLLLSDDFSETKILLSRQRSLLRHPQAIVYDKKTQELWISYYRKNYVDKFKLP